MHFKIKNWKLALLAFLGICFFVSLGCWQMARANYKKNLLKNFAARTEQIPLTSSALKEVKKDFRFYRAKLVGHFDNEHTLLLDNKTYNGQVGYEVYTPFVPEDLNFTFLVDRGFIARAQIRQKPPNIAPILGKASIVGMLNLPPKYFALGKISESAKPTWPLRIQYINFQELNPLLATPVVAFFPYVLSLEPKQLGTFSMEWKIVTVTPDRHKGYAVQWFALALTLLILFVALNRNPKRKP